MGVVSGVALSATCGFRVFLPMLGLSLAGRFGFLSLAPDFRWIADTPALLAFALATLLEVAAYYVPWLDNLLDTLATPAAVLAGTLVAASLAGELPPLVRWTMAIVAGGGAAGVIQAGTVTLRGISSVFSAGLGNALVSTGELLCAVVLVVLVILLPLVAFILAVILVFWGGMRLLRLAGNRKAGKRQAADASK